MSTALAVAGVTAVLRSMLDAWLSDQNANGALGGANAEVSAVAPDMIELTGANAGPRLNLFLHHVTSNTGWSNVDLPALNGDGQRVASPPLALDLHYLLTAYGPAELQPEVLLGYGMQRLHQAPILGRADIEARLPATLAASALGRQVEMIKVTPEPMGSEELSKLWTALQAHYRPSAAYKVSVVLIESPAQAIVARPVLSRGVVDPVSGRERGVVVVPNVGPLLPLIGSIVGPDGQAGGALGESIDIGGVNLSGAGRTVVLENRLLEVSREIAAAPATSDDTLRFVVPNVPAQLPIGVYTVRVRLTPLGAAGPCETNDLAMAIWPRIVAATTPVARSAAGIAVVGLTVRPQVRSYQRAALLLGSREIPADPHPGTTGNLSFSIPAAEAGAYLAAVRVDGLESPRVDRLAAPPSFTGTPVVIT